MTGVFDAARDYAQNHPMSVAVGLIIALPGTYLFVTGQSICASGLCKTAPSPLYSTIIQATEGPSVYQSQHPLDLRLNLPISRWSDKPTPAYVLQAIGNLQESIASLLSAIGDRTGVDTCHILKILEDRWAKQFPVSRFALVAATTTLPGAFLVLIRNHPNSWAAKHQHQVANALHVLALVTVANQRISIQDLLVAIFVMALFKMVRMALGSVSAWREKPLSAIESLSSETRSVVAESNIVVSSGDALGKMQEQSDRPHHDNNEIICKDLEILRLQGLLADANTSKNVTETEFKRAQSDHRIMQDTLNETIAECLTLREEMKTLKQTIGRNHQTIVYRKDIELFALRKGNEQKENCIKDKDARLEEIHQKYRATLELKDAQLQNLNDRIAFLEHNDICKMSGEVEPKTEDKGDCQAVQVKLLRVRGRNSLEVDQSNEDKDVEIAKLKSELNEAARSCEALAQKQDELRRAWSATYEIQNSLIEEQQMHAQTKEKLHEVAIRLDEEVKRNTQKNSPTRLPTIEEQDKNELETIFNATQQDNLKLYSELDVLDKRLREANTHVFVCDQEIESLREHLRLEKAINEDMETARPSLVHRVHFQRMEGQLKESRDVLEIKNEEIAGLKKTSAARNSEVENLKKAKDEVVHSHAQLQEEKEILKKKVKDLELTKEQLMLDHERLAQHRSRQRTTSAEHTSARLSGTTLITDTSIQAPRNSDEPLPTRPVTLVEETRVQNTPASTYKPDTNRVTMISNDLPPLELRGTRKKRLSLKDFMRKITDRDQGVESSKSNDGKEKVQDQSRLKTGLAPKNKNALLRPNTAAAPVLKVEAGKENAQNMVRPQTAAPIPTPASTKEEDGKTPTRYYAAQEHQSRAAEQNEEVDAAVEASSPRPKSRGWSNSRKLVRKSMG